MFISSMRSTAFWIPVILVSPFWRKIEQCGLHVPNLKEQDLMLIASSPIDGIAFWVLKNHHKMPTPAKLYCTGPVPVECVSLFFHHTFLLSLVSLIQFRSLSFAYSSIGGMQQAFALNTSLYYARISGEGTFLSRQSASHLVLLSPSPPML